ncbi:MAG: D-alanyl-D-alanine carboxypeptidase family protein [Clostridiales bacterium]|nr:D-alanyl-D-alanine carboxypeptidase family protein [Clostridiales bacterium]
MKKLLCVLMMATLLIGCVSPALSENLDDPDGEWGEYMDPNEAEGSVSVMDEHYGEGYAAPAEEAGQEDAAEEAGQDESAETEPAEEEAAPVAEESALQPAASAGAPEVKWTYGVSLTSLKSPWLLLVNKDNKLGEDYEPQVPMKMNKLKRTSSTTWYLEEEAGKALALMFEAASTVTSYDYVYTHSDGTQEIKTVEYEKGMTLYLESAYRSYGTQATSYYNRLERNNGVDDGYVAMPGASEHQTGLCADILDYTYRDKAMNEGFANTPEAQWMLENAASFGFVLRYPKDKEDITGIKYEPWHYRYVGKEVAQYMTLNNLCLEEFTVEYQQAMEDFAQRGGNEEEQLAYELIRLNAPPESNILEECDETGDPDVSLIF